MLRQSVEQVRELSHSSRDRIFFVATLWVALATALLFALLPLGLPLTTSIGSAFSPATTAVALRGRAQQLKAPADQVLKDDTHSPADQKMFDTLAPPELAALSPIDRIAAAILAHLDPHPIPPAAHMALAYPRGPPTV
ncbi:MAG: hypothetical protein AB7G25_10750 [Sphingomonadaceae bacterium]